MIDSYLRESYLNYLVFFGKLLFDKRFELIDNIVVPFK